MIPLPFAKKSLGQHWLSDTAILDDIVQAADVKTGDTVLEIGPGTGTLTERLLHSKAKVIALEFDQDLVKELRKKYKNLSSSQLQIQEGDIRTFNFSTLPSIYKIVANIPYYLTANLLRTLTTSSNKPTMSALLVQKEVAERIAAQPGQMGLISVIAQFYYKVSKGQVVGAELFTPPPKVDSQVLILKLRPKPLFNDVDEKQFFRIVKSGFAARRKTILNSLAGGLRTDKLQVKKLLDLALIDPATRPQSLALEDWHRLYQVWSKQNR